MSKNNFLGMSDEEFLALDPNKADDIIQDSSSSGNSGEDTLAGGEDTVTGAEDTVTGGEDTVTGGEGADTIDSGSNADTVPGGADGSDTISGADTLAGGADTVAGGEKKPEEKPADKKPEGEGEKKEEVAPDYEAFYNTVMKPFKANGKMIELRSPDEAVRLMQMGANYGKRLQEIQPHLKTIKMLEKNNLLDEGALSLLIDIHQKKPEAIKQIIKDSGIDPLDINTEDKTSYTPGNHSVSDAEIVFDNALKDIQSQEGGQETINVIAQTWDQQSKSLLWESPELLAVIQDQRVNGIYDQITAEIDRQKLLGTIPQNTPFIHAYKLAGDSLVETNRLVGGDQGQKPTAQTTVAEPVRTPNVVATRAEAPKPPVANGEKARAASPSKTTPRTATVVVNPLELSDEEYLKQFNGRL
jgi:hypothetical protein